jgi:hypothetical protein
MVCLSMTGKVGYLSLGMLTVYLNDNKEVLRVKI